MVSYTDWTRIGHNVYRDLGGTYDESTAVSVTQTLAAFWSDNKTDLEDASEAEARQIARQNMNV